MIYKKIKKITPNLVNRKYLIPEDRKRLEQINNLLSKHNLTISEKQIRNVSSKQANHRDVFDRLTYVVKKKATLAELKNINTLFFEKKYMFSKQATDVLKKSFNFKRFVFSKTGGFDLSFFSSGLYKEYHLLYNNLKQIHQEKLYKKVNKRRKQSTFFDIFTLDAFSKKNIVTPQLTFLKEYQRLVRNLYSPALSKKKTFTDIHSFERNCRLKTKIVLEDVLLGVNNHVDKLHAFGVINKILENKKNISSKELLLIGDNLSLFSSSQKGNAISLIDSLFSAYIEKVKDQQIYKRKLTKKEKEIKQRNSFENLINVVNDYLSKAKDVDKINKLERFVKVYEKHINI